MLHRPLLYGIGSLFTDFHETYFLLSVRIESIYYFKKYVIIFLLYATQPHHFLYYKMKGLINTEGGIYDRRKNHRTILAAFRDCH